MTEKKKSLAAIRSELGDTTVSEALNKEEKVNIVHKNVGPKRQLIVNGTDYTDQLVKLPWDKNPLKSLKAQFERRNFRERREDGIEDHKDDFYHATIDVNGCFYDFYLTGTSKVNFTVQDPGAITSFGGDWDDPSESSVQSAKRLRHEFSDWFFYGYGEYERKAKRALFAIESNIEVNQIIGLNVIVNQTMTDVSLESSLIASNDMHASSIRRRGYSYNSITGIKFRRVEIRSAGLVMSGTISDSYIANANLRIDQASIRSSLIKQSYLNVTGKGYSTIESATLSGCHINSDKSITITFKRNHVLNDVQFNGDADIRIQSPLDYFSVDVGNLEMQVVRTGSSSPRRYSDPNKITMSALFKNRYSEEDLTFSSEDGLDKIQEMIADQLFPKGDKGSLRPYSPFSETTPEKNIVGYFANAIHSRLKLLDMVESLSTIGVCNS